MSSKSCFVLQLATQRDRCPSLFLIHMRICATLARLKEHTARTAQTLFSAFALLAHVVGWRTAIDANFPTCTISHLCGGKPDNSAFGAVPRLASLQTCACSSECGRSAHPSAWYSLMRNLGSGAVLSDLAFHLGALALLLPLARAPGSLCIWTNRSTGESSSFRPPADNLCRQQHGMARWPWWDGTCPPASPSRTGCTSDGQGPCNMPSKSASFPHSLFAIVIVGSSPRSCWSCTCHRRIWWCHSPTCACEVPSLCTCTTCSYREAVNVSDLLT